MRITSTNGLPDVDGLGREGYIYMNREVIVNVIFFFWVKVRTNSDSDFKEY